MSTFAKPAYFIQRWGELFEIAQGRRPKRLRWVAVPNRHDSTGYRRVISMERGLELYGTWMLMVQIASKMPIRGILASEAGPLSIEDLAAITGAPGSAFKRAIRVLGDDRIGWIGVEEWASLRARYECSQSGDNADARLLGTTGQDRTSQHRTGQAGVFQTVGGTGGLHLEAADLRDADRLKVVFAECVELGYFTDSEANRRDFFAMVKHAQRVGKTNPAGLLAANLRQWSERRSFITGEDERAAEASLQRMARMVG